MINFSDDKSTILRETTRRLLEAERERCRDLPHLTPEVLINEAAVQERERLRHQGGFRASNARRFWSRVSREFHQVDEAGREKILEDIARLYAEEIHGGFDPKLHGLAARVFPAFLKLLLNRLSPAGILAALGNRLSLEENLVISGPVDQIRRLAERGTLILVPNHASNLDSIVIGLGLHRSGLPPFTYGAGLNLFSNPVLAYCMNRLGAYKVDRGKKNTLYKDVLKQYATLSLENGNHNLFFPGGTRNRRGDVERHLKLGLLGCGIPAYLANLGRGRPHDFFVIPATLSYALVLEAKSLIEEHLKEEGKSRFIRVRSDFSRPMRMLRFWRNLQSLHSQIHLRFGAPLDLFGNAVDAEGISRDRHGRAVDRRKYLEIGGVPSPSPQRDREYTRELGNALTTAYLRDNTALCTHVAAFAAFAAIRAAHPNPDFYRFLRFSGPEYSVPLEAILCRMDALLDRLRHCEDGGGIRLAESLRGQDGRTAFAAALSHFRSYHDGEVLLDEKGRVFSLNLKLLYYYRNHLDHYGLEG